MGRELSRCDTYDQWEEELPEPEEEDFFREVVANSLRAKVAAEKMQREEERKKAEQKGK